MVLQARMVIIIRGKGELPQKGKWDFWEVSDVFFTDLVDGYNNVFFFFEN